MGRRAGATAAAAAAAGAAGGAATAGTTGAPTPTGALMCGRAACQHTCHGLEATRATAGAGEATGPAAPAGVATPLPMLAGHATAAGAFVLLQAGRVPALTQVKSIAGGPTFTPQLATGVKHHGLVCVAVMIVEQL